MECKHVTIFRFSINLRILDIGPTAEEASDNPPGLCVVDQFVNLQDMRRPVERLAVKAEQNKEVASTGSGMDGWLPSFEQPPEARGSCKCNPHRVGRLKGHSGQPERAPHLDHSLPGRPGSLSQKIYIIICAYAGDFLL